MRTMRIASVLAVLMIGAAFVMAAEPAKKPRRSRGGRMRSSLLGLLSSDQVRAELKVSDEAAGKIKKISEKLRADMRAKYGEMRKIKDETERRAAYEKLRTEYDSSSRKQLHEVLAREQMIRLYQIRSQYRAVSDTLSSKYVAGKLKLTDEQKAKAARIGADSRTKRYAIYKTMRGADEAKRTEARKKLSEIRIEADKQALAMLTEGQRKTLEEMKGKKFEFKTNDGDAKKKPAGK